MPKLSILLSTIDDRIYNSEKILQTSLPDSEYIVVHQISNALQGEEYFPFYNKFSSPQYKFLQQFEKGTGKSRNYALENASGEILFICDDDISFTPNFYDSILENANKYPEADIFTFMIKDTEDRPYKQYFKNVRWHTLRSLARVSNVEIALRKKFYDKTKVKFDERFGLGTIFNTGEEFVFLSEALKHKAKILFVPVYIAVHPAESSGKQYAPDLIKAKGAMIAKVYGRKYWIINFLFAIKKYKEYKSKFSLFSFLKYIYAGSFQFYKNE